MNIEWRHCHLLSRLAGDVARTGPLDALHDLEAEGFVVSEGAQWFPTSEGRRALRAQLATRPSWQ